MSVGIKYITLDGQERTLDELFHFDHVTAALLALSILDIVRCGYY